MKNITKKTYSPEFKTRVAKDLLREDRTISEICSEYKIHPTQASNWKRKAIESMRNGFKNPLRKDKKVKLLEEEKNDLYNKIGQLTVELDWLKKKL